MAAPIVYRWDDSGAPVARGERRSLCDILYACLVTGYGSKAAAGWTREYVNDTFDKAVFRGNPTGGTGFFLQVDGATGATANASNVKAFEAMADIDTGLFPFYASAQVAYSSSTGDTTARPWILIADDKAFYFYCWTSITTTPTTSTFATFGMSFGDLVKWDASDGFACGLHVGATATRCGLGSLAASNTGAAALAYGVCIPRPASGVATPIIAAQIRGGGPGDDTSQCGVNGVPYVVDGPILVSRPHINNAAAYSLRGWLPGFYYPCHPLALDQLVNYTIDSKNFLSLHCAVGAAHVNLLFLLDDWRA